MAPAPTHSRPSTCRLWSSTASMTPSSTPAADGERPSWCPGPGSCSSRTWATTDPRRCGLSWSTRSSSTPTSIEIKAFPQYRAGRRPVSEHGTHDEHSPACDEMLKVVRQALDVFRRLLLEAFDFDDLRN